MRPAAPGPETAIYSPSEINREVRTHLEAGFARIWLRGEISNLARPASGHLYFSLKDARAQIRCALFRGNATGLGFRPANGDEVLVRGRLSLYEPRGDYQLIADGLLAAGAGALQQAFEALKRKLEQEGLFASERKQPLPAWPARIGVITSPSGAAVRDILNVLAQRWPLARVRVYAAQVQGEQAPAELIRALLAADRDGFAEVLLLARGGGSLEDLWAFNDEQLARTIAALKTPVACGVGHETDFTIADFVADLRAPTPSAAAAAVTPDGPALKRQLNGLEERLRRTTQRALDQQAQRLDYLDRRLTTRHPQRRLQESLDHCIRLEQRLGRAIRRKIQSEQQRAAALGQRLQSASPRSRLNHGQDRLAALRHRLALAVRRQLDRLQDRLTGQTRALDNVSPLRVLERGYAVVRDADGTALTRAGQFRAGQEVHLLFRRFQVQATITRNPLDGEPNQTDLTR